MYQKRANGNAAFFGFRRDFPLHREVPDPKGSQGGAEAALPRVARQLLSATGRSLDAGHLAAVEPDKPAGTARVDHDVARSVVGVYFHQGVAGRAVDFLLELLPIERARPVVRPTMRAAAALDQPGEVIAGDQKPAAGFAEEDAAAVERPQEEVAVAVGTLDGGGPAERHDPVGREFQRLGKVERSAAGALQVLAAFDESQG